MLEAAGVCPAWIYAYQNTGGLLLWVPINCVKAPDLFPSAGYWG
jgi:hypothetical protein